ncbi:hypothetical protein B0H14DRAFT_2565137 [Mycena olivaceomarginata]|nr:hypothetical protein B0H14DRAFT_2565137 [Mycena olivaceomarginata]
MTAVIVRPYAVYGTANSPTKMDLLFPDVQIMQIKNDTKQQHEELLAILKAQQTSAYLVDPRSCLLGDWDSLKLRPEIFHGRESELEDIVKILIQDSARIAILGTGGMGKTSLAPAAFHHAQVEAKYSQRYFVSHWGGEGIQPNSAGPTQSATGHRKVLSPSRPNPRVLRCPLSGNWTPNRNRNRTQNPALRRRFQFAPPGLGDEARELSHKLRDLPIPQPAHGWGIPHVKTRLAIPLLEACFGRRPQRCRTRELADLWHCGDAEYIRLVLRRRAEVEHPDEPHAEERQREAHRFSTGVRVSGILPILEDYRDTQELLDFFLSRAHAHQDQDLLLII